MKKPTSRKNSKAVSVVSNYADLVGGISELLESARRTSARTVNAVTADEKSLAAEITAARRNLEARKS